MAAQTVQSLKLSHPGMVLTAAIPFRGQAGRFKPHDRRCYDELIEKADEVIVLSEHYYPRCFLDRDEFMVCNAAQIIAYYDGKRRNLLHHKKGKRDGYFCYKLILERL